MESKRSRPTLPVLQLPEEDEDGGGGGGGGEYTDGMPSGGGQLEGTWIGGGVVTPYRLPRSDHGHGHESGFEGDKSGRVHHSCCDFGHLLNAGGTLSRIPLGPLQSSSSSPPPTGERGQVYFRNSLSTCTSSSTNPRVLKHTEALGMSLANPDQDPASSSSDAGK